MKLFIVFCKYLTHIYVIKIFDMKRSTFVRLSVLAVIAMAFSVYILRFKKTVRSILEKDSENLTLKDNDTIDRFMNDADKEDYWRQFSTAKQMFICVQHFFYSFGVQLPLYSKYLQYRSTITGQFLLSTSLFMDITNYSVSYTGFYNQYKRACSNPFSSNFYPETA